MRRFMRASFGGQGGVGITEYAILLILAAVVIITVVSRFGKTVGGQVDSTRKTVQRLGDGQEGHIGGPESAPTHEGDQAGHIGEGGPASAPETKPQALPDAVDQPHDRGIDTRLFILFGFGSLVVVLILMAIAKRRPKDTRPPSPPPEPRKEKTESYTRTTDSRQ
jgi:Flp pilus assembly pilin Flp